MRVAEGVGGGHFSRYSTKIQKGKMGVMLSDVAFDRFGLHGALRATRRGDGGDKLTVIVEDDGHDEFDQMARAEAVLCGPARYLFRTPELMPIRRLSYDEAGAFT